MSISETKVDNIRLWRYSIVMKGSGGMNVFLLTDLEGIPGIFSIDQLDRQSENYVFACEKLTRTINLATELCKKYGAENIYYLDGHAGGGNVFEEKIDNPAMKVTIDGWAQLLKEKKLDCVLELGCHARAGTFGGFLDHTNSSARVFEYRINGAVHGELSSHAVFCGAYGVPTVFCCGDEAACSHAKEYIPDIVTVSVKIAHKRNECKGYENTDAILEKAIAQALAKYQSIKPYDVPEIITVQMTFYRTDMCEDALERAKFPCKRVDARTLERTFPKEELVSFYQMVF